MDIELYDTTLRDGSQQEGISLSVEDKIKITKKLDELGIHYIEGGWPGSNPKDEEYFAAAKSLKLIHAKVAAFGSTRRANVEVDQDMNIKLLIDAETPVVTIVGKSSDVQVINVLETSLEENLAMIYDSISFIKQKGRQVFFDAEHFFDGYRSNPEYALQCLQAASTAGADCLVLCDTNGGVLTDEIPEIVMRVTEFVGGSIGIHCHNDTDMAVANSIAALKAGAVHVQGTVNGYGERCGNANIISLIANLKIKMDVECISDFQLESLTDVAHYVSDIVNIPPNSQQPYVGVSSFTHKGGLHAAAMAKMDESYQHVSPSLVGNLSRIVVSELSGRGNIRHRLRELGLERTLSSEQELSLLQNIKIRESKGFQYETAGASFELMARRIPDNYKAPFGLVDFMVMVENNRRTSVLKDLEGNEDLLAEAMVKVNVDERIMHTVAEGNGPVNALDNALRKALLEFYPSLIDVKLLDYKVRVVDEGQDTKAVVRVLIESTDGRTQWQTVGASSNIIEASWMAISDSFEYFLIHS
tara:strand:- start:608 stop:2194 length:1587 start_codon:yes stop_codon:yes gene_type:complete